MTDEKTDEIISIFWAFWIAFIVVVIGFWKSLFIGIILLILIVLVAGIIALISFFAYLNDRIEKYNKKYNLKDKFLTARLNNSRLNKWLIKITSRHQ